MGGWNCMLKLLDEEQVRKPYKVFHLKYLYPMSAWFYFFVQHRKSSLWLWPESSSPGRRRRWLWNKCILTWITLLTYMCIVWHKVWCQGTLCVIFWGKVFKLFKWRGNNLHQSWDNSKSVKKHLNSFFNLP